MALSLRAVRPFGPGDMVKYGRASVMLSGDD